MSDEKKEPLLDHKENGVSDHPMPKHDVVDILSPPSTETPTDLWSTVRVLLQNQPLLLVVCFGCLGGLLFG